MYIGRLNERISDLTFSVYQKDTFKPEKNCSVLGNPFCGEKLSYKWCDLSRNGVDVSVSLGEEWFINNVVVTLGEKSKPASVSLYNKDKTELLFRYSAETGKGVVEKVLSLSAERKLSDFVIEFNSDFSSVIIESIDLFGADFQGKAIFPTPSKMRFEDREVSISDFSTYTCACDESIDAGKIMAEKISEKAGFTPIDAKDGKIQFVMDETVKKNGYRIDVSAEKITIASSDKRGFVIGAETLIKLISEGKIPCCEIDDEPFCEFRGVHLFVPAEDQMPFFKHLIRDLLSPMGYNFIILQLSGALQYESHPEINEAFLNAIAHIEAGEWPIFPHQRIGGSKIVSKKSVRDLIGYARSFGIEMIPEIQSLSHVQYLTITYPDIAENEVPGSEYTVKDEREADIPPSGFYKHSFCPSNPKSYKILFDLIDEVVDLFQPKEYVHMGHDELYQVGLCPQCREKEPADILAEDLNRIHAYLATKGLKMMIWGDMLQPVTKYNTSRAIENIPKDILLLDFIWYFHLDKDIEENLLMHGFDVLIGNLYSSHFPRYEKRIRKEGIRGGQVSTWVEAKCDVLAREGKLYDFIYTAQMLWSDSYSKFCRYSYDSIISQLIPSMREKLEQRNYPSLALESSESILYQNDKLEFASNLSGSEFTVGNSFQSLIFEIAATDFMRRIPWEENKCIANFRVVYQDGSAELVPLVYGNNLSHWDRRQNEPFAAAFYRHNGYSGTWFSDGKRVSLSDKEGTVYRYEWINPKPDCHIEKVVYEQLGDDGVYIHQISAIQK